MAPRALPRRRGPAGGQEDPTCRVRYILNRVGDKWSLNIIYELAQGPRRFTQLKQAIGGISQRMLTVTLRGLERDGLISRTVYPVVPPRVDYELTPLGTTLLDTVMQLMHWTIDHVDDIDRARKEYDARADALPSAKRHASSPFG